MSDEQNGKHWRIATARIGWRGGAWDLGQRPFTHGQAVAEAARLNEAYPEYSHVAVHKTWPLKKGKG